MAAEQLKVRRGGRPRSEDADRAIIEATLDLLADVGITGLSIEHVAATAGVGRTTVYRRWPNKEALIVDALAALKGPIPEVPGRSLREDLITLFEAQGHDHQAARDRRLYSCMAGEMGRHPELAKLYRDTVIAPRHEATRHVLRAAVQRGELRPDVDIELMRHLFTAPVLQWIQTHPDEPIKRDYVARLFDAVLDGLAAKD
jgi:AcrR family transcriptional regulator